ncbi:hypothetical protein CVV38_03515 [Candidatus Peregrinibacteria bacterium HGW-Peregrinibacteria-1]|jgi:ferredoxin-NADP reductase|nr:MAG: hypothetical protein CVV38_03515 [Candidatus Peregrinibacteria bacterium HGW-Peregrinibacteria-1]
MLKTATLKEIKNLTRDVLEITFENSEDIEFEAGQFITIKIDDKTPPCFRAYSLNNSNFDKKKLQLCIKVIPNGRGSNWLTNLKTEDQINYLGPNGKFTFKSPSDKNVLFIGTGTGLAPLKSMIENQLQNGSQQNIELLFGVRHEEDIFYLDYFRDLEKKHPNFKFHLTLSQPKEDSAEYHKGRVTDYLEQNHIDPKNTDFYICGLKAMIESVQELLQSKGVPSESIHFEKYD